MLHDTLMLTSVLRQSRTFGLNEEQFYFNSFTSKFTVNYILIEIILTRNYRL